MSKKPVILAAVAALTLGGSMAGAVAAPTEGDAAVVTSGFSKSDYQPFDKNQIKIPAKAGERVIEVKFRHSADVRAEQGRMAGADSAAMQLLNSDQVSKAQPLFLVSQEELRTLSETAERSSGESLADLTKWVYVEVAEGQDAQAVAAKLNASEDVEVAYVRPESRLMNVRSVPGGGVEKIDAGETDVTTQASPDLTSQQGYLYSPESHYGINAEYAHTIKGGDGSGVTVADVEGGWNTRHEDLSKLRNATITKGTPRPEAEYHGTAVMGEILADKNSFGVTGIAHGAKGALSHVKTSERGFDPANAIVTAANYLSAGDVLVVELQTYGCKGNGGRGDFVPQEYVPSSYDAIKAATAKGIHVVAAAGNGNENLDAGCYGSSFPNGKADSGSIIVGAGAGKASGRKYCGRMGNRQDFSTHGSRVNSFAWGLCVVTTDAGTTSYTKNFSGTSSATPIVAGAVASLSGIAKARGINLSPAQMRDLLSRTGTRANRGAEIGTMPDLKKAIAELDKMGGNPTPDPVTPTPDPVTPTPDPVEPTPEDPAPGVDCKALDGSVRDRVSAGSQLVLPRDSWYYSQDGDQTFCISSSGGGLKLEIQTWDRGWKSVASTQTTKATEVLQYTGSRGYYRLMVTNEGSGTKNFTLDYRYPQ